jgi:hypothetical protein
MRNSLRLVTGLILLVIFLCPQNGLGVTIDSTSDDFAVNWLLTTAQGAPIDLSATATFDVTTVATNGSGLITSITFNVHFSNTTVLSGATTEAGITTLGSVLIQTRRLSPLQITQTVHSLLQKFRLASKIFLGGSRY